MNGGVQRTDAVASIEVRLSGTGEEIEGTVEMSPGTPTRKFSGWIELISVLEGWRTDALGEGSAAGPSS